MTDASATESRTTESRTTEPRAHWGRLIGASVAVLAAAFVVPAFVRPPDLVENRRLAEAPPPPTGLADLTAYRRAVDAYVADRFPPRALLIGGLNRLRLAFGVSGSDRVIVGRNGWLFHDDGTHLGTARGVPPLTDAQAQAWLAGLAGRREALAAEGKAYLVLSPALKASLYPWEAPGWFRLDANRPAVTLSSLSGASGAGQVLYLNEALAQQAAWGLRTYSRHDTHWTGLGAYIGYAAFMRALEAKGLAEGPRPLEAFVESRAGLINKPRDLALMLGVARFVDINHPELSDPGADGGLQVSYLDPARRDWTGLRVIDTGQAGKPVLLMTVDSFSNALLPFLLGHFSRIITVHNDQGFWRPDLIARFDPDIVVTEVVESGLTSAMQRGPAASPEAMARIGEAVAGRHRYRATRDPAAPRTTAHALEGDDGPNRLMGSGDRDEIQARKGDDTVEGRGGDDVLRGGRGRDRIDGGEGNDWVSGGRDDDTLRGGRGADVFNSFVGAGTDVVMDFSIAERDRVELDPEAVFTVRQDGPDTVVEMDGAKLVLKGIKAADLPKGAIQLSP